MGTVSFDYKWKQFSEVGTNLDTEIISAAFCAG